MITGSHGIRGLVKVKAFTEDQAALTAYGPLTDAAGATVFSLTLQSRHKDQWLARIDGVADRDAADRLKGQRLFADRDRLPEPDADEFYYTDLIGLAAVGPEGQALGTVRRVVDFGAGDVLEIETPDGAEFAVAFTRAAVPVVDIPGGRIVVDLPAEVTVPPGPGVPPDAQEQDDRGVR